MSHDARDPRELRLDERLPCARPGTPPLMVTLETMARRFYQESGQRPTACQLGRVLHDRLRDELTATYGLGYVLRTDDVIRGIRRPGLVATDPDGEGLRVERFLGMAVQIIADDHRPGERVRLVARVETPRG